MPEPLNPNYCCGCRWWNYRCTLPESLACGNVYTLRQLAANSYGAADVAKAAALTELDKEMKRKDMEIQTLENAAAAMHAGGTKWAGALEEFCRALGAADAGGWNGVLFASSDRAGDYVISEPALDRRELVAKMTRAGRTNTVRMKAYSAAAAQLAGEIVQTLRAQRLRLEADRTAEIENEWKTEQLRLAQERRKQNREQ